MPISPAKGTVMLYHGRPEYVVVGPTDEPGRMRFAYIQKIVGTLEPSGTFGDTFSGDYMATGTLNIKLPLEVMECSVE